MMNVTNAGRPYSQFMKQKKEMPIVSRDREDASMADFLGRAEVSPTAEGGCARTFAFLSVKTFLSASAMMERDRKGKDGLGGGWGRSGR